MLISKREKEEVKNYTGVSYTGPSGTHCAMVTGLSLSDTQGQVALTVYGAWPKSVRHTGPSGTHRAMVPGLSLSNVTLTHKTREILYLGYYSTAKETRIFGESRAALPQFTGSTDTGLYKSEFTDL